ncbi:hypothetical protein ACJIZ3_014392 [Penstemon smallii]|uniref:Reverse transcriptase domain-containing protein n=1 Tax=Penstemon smallii TaxID=265156 RepID=A0ABD3RJI9_9LAMI
MSTLAWNCRGLGKPEAGRALKDLLRRSKPDFVFLCEIKTHKLDIVSNILSTSSLPNHHFVPPQKFAGGLCLAWTANLNVNITSYDLSHINALILYEPCPDLWQFTGVMFSFASNKSPGPDGLPALFYKNFWSITGNALVLAVQHFFRTGFLLKALNHTLVTLIPKQNKLNQVENFRPISLCNLAYKVISKILANRLKPLLHNIISSNQMAFVEGRNINENSIISQEIMHYLHKRKGKKGFLAIKVDLSKAYDRKFINLIAQCISTCSFSFLISGSPYGFLKPSRGIRQGDPISPYLFIIYSELLSKMLIREETAGHFRGVKIARTSPIISHLLYADDIIVYCRDTMDDVGTIMSVLDKFLMWSGQCINQDKSFVHYSKNVEPEFKHIVDVQVNLKECNHKSKHLGLPFCKPKARVQAFTDVVTKFQQKLSGWKSKNLSQAGRAILIKSVAQAMPTYQMSTFLLPISICDMLDKIARKFWWGENERGNSFYLRCWSSLCLPKACGGLGFRKSVDFNRAHIAKLGWHCANKDNSLWVKLLDAKYLKGASFFDPIQPPKDASWVWSDICKSKELILSNSCFTISVDSSVQTWTQNWIPSLPGFVPTPKCPSSLQPLDFGFVKDLLFPVNIVKEIRKIFISPSHTTQQLIWIPSKSGKFSTKSCYLASQKVRFPQLNSDDIKMFKNLWSARLHNRYKILLWKIIFGILLTKKRLNRFIHVNNIECPLCGDEVENLDHLFLRCPFAKAIWFNSSWSLKVECFANVPVRNWIAMLLDKNANLFPSNEIREFFLIFAALTFDSIWFNTFAIVVACSRIHDVKAKNVIFESDCLIAINAILNQDGDMDWAIREPVDEIRRFWVSWPKWRFQFIARASNCAAHNLASWAAVSKTWEKIPLPSLPLCCFCDGGSPCVDVVPNIYFY